MCGTQSYREQTRALLVDSIHQIYSALCGARWARSWTVLNYLCPSIPVEHRPSTTPRHRTLFWAALVIPNPLVPCCFSSASVSRLQLLRERPPFLFPCGFQVRAWRVVLDAGFLSVCPIVDRASHIILRSYVHCTQVKDGVGRGWECCNNTAPHH